MSTGLRLYGEDRVDSILVSEDRLKDRVVELGETIADKLEGVIDPEEHRIGSRRSRTHRPGRP